MDDLQILSDLGVVVGAATVALLVLRVVHLPPILAYIVAGLAVGPLAGILALTPSLELFSELGITLLLFLVGLELSPERMRSVGMGAVLAGLIQVAVSTGAGAGLALLLGFEGGEALLLGLALAFSSTVVVVKLLDREGALGALHGRVAVGILLVQDVVVAVVLTLLRGLGGGGGAGEVAGALATAFGGIGALAMGAALGARWLLPPVVRWCSASPEALFVVGLAWCFAFIVGAETLHVSLELGAFIAGVALAQLRWATELRRRVHPLVDFFLAVFFVALGASMDPGAALSLWPAALALTVLVCVGKPLVVGVALARLGYPRDVAVRAGVALGQASEFGLVLAALAAGAGLAGPGLVAVVGMVALLSIAVSSLAVPRSDAIAAAGGAAAAPPGGEGGSGPGSDGHGGPAGHVVVVGMNALGRRIVDALVERGAPVLAVDTDAAKLEGLPAPSLVGSTDQLATLAEAGVERALLVVSSLQIEDANALLTWRCGRAGVPVSVHAFLPSLAGELRALGAEHLMVSKHDGARRLAADLDRLGVLR